MLETFSGVLDLSCRWTFTPALDLHRQYSTFLYFSNTQKSDFYDIMQTDTTCFTTIWI